MFKVVIFQGILRDSSATRSYNSQEESTALPELLLGDFGGGFWTLQLLGFCFSCLGAAPL